MPLSTTPIYAGLEGCPVYAWLPHSQTPPSRRSYWFPLPCCLRWPSPGPIFTAARNGNHPPPLALQDLVLQQPSFSVIESVVFTSGSTVAAAKTTQAHVPHFHKLKCSARVAVTTSPDMRHAKAVRSGDACLAFPLLRHTFRAQQIYVYRSVPKERLVGHGVFKGITLHSVCLFPLSQRTEPDKVAATAVLLNGLTLRLVHRGVTTQCPRSVDRVFHPATSITTPTKQQDQHRTSTR